MTVTSFLATYIGSITSFLWNFADPASGVNNTSTAQNPTHLFSAIGSYNVTLIISNGFATDTVTGIYTITDCTCWPGDCNNDGEVNCEDIFPIGIFYSNTGPTRNNASINFTSQPYQDWGFPIMYLQTIADRKLANTNGDGIIDGLDVAAISSNYGLHHNNHNNITALPEATATSPSMYIQFSSSTATAGTTVTATIYLGTQAIPVNYMYGYSFSILYDAAMVVPGSATISTANNWLGDASNEFSVSHDNYAAGRIDAGVVRFNSIEVVGGYGAIATVTFQLQNNATGTFHLSLAPSAKVLTIDTYYTASAGGIELFVPVNLVGDNLSVQNAVGVSTYSDDNSVQVFPNPATDIINVMFNNTEVSEIKLMNTLGQVVYTNTGHFTNSIKINTFDFAKGIYTLSCKTKDGIVVKKINVIK
jgi:PKD repeat protein